MREFWPLYGVVLLVVGCSSNAATLDDQPGAGRNGQAAFEEIVLEPKEGQVVLRHNGVAHFDPESGKISWPALVCTWDNCPGKGPDGPHVFPRKIDGVTIGPNGEIEFPRNVKTVHGVFCPVCNHEEGVYPYIPPEVQRRKAALADELARSRAAYKDARRRRLSPPADHRPPQQILDAMANLPRIYISD